MIKKYLKYALVLVLIVSSMYIFSGCGNKKNENEGNNGEVNKEVYEEPLRNYMEGLRTKDIELILKAYPDFMQKMTQADIDSIYSRYEAMYGSNVTMEYNLGDAVRIEDKSDLNVLASQIKEYYPEAGDIEVSDAYIITVELTVSGDGAETEAEENSEGEESKSQEGQNKKTDSQDFYVYKYGENWYIF
ncbi:MAG: hypothetical protein IJH12_06380 [Clostridia bacterium]|nr:hypothetical protein [Clostridia bacterium]